MHDARLPQLQQRAADFSSELHHQLLWQPVGRCSQTAVEVSAVAELSDDEAEGSGVEDVEDADGVRRVAGPLAANLVFEQSPLFRCLEHLPVHHLHADQLKGLSVHPHVSVASHSASDSLTDAELVGPESFQGLRWWWWHGGSLALGLQQGFILVCG